MASESRTAKPLSPRPATAALAPESSSDPQNPNTLPGELDQIRAYVEATNTHIHYLEDLIEPSAAEQIAEIKRGLKDAHRGLENLEGKFAIVSEITREVWQTYRRLRELEEKMKGGEDASVRRMRRRVVRAVPAVQTASVVEGDEFDFADLEFAEEDEDENEAGDRKTAQRESTLVSSGRQTAVGEELYMTPETLGSPRTNYEEGGQDTLVVPPRRVPAYVPTRGKRASPGPNTVEDSRKTKFDPLVKPTTAPSPETPAKTRSQVLASIAEEEKHTGTKIIDPDRRREGSASGWIITLAVMSADSNPNLCVPHLPYIKIHEVRDLQTWLQEHKYLHRSRSIHRLEKTLHLLTVLQTGCRFESVAVLFSRTPREVVGYCKEVFDGLLEMHSETMLPGRNHESKYLYPHLWHILANYRSRRDHGSKRLYYPWAKEDIRKVLVTLNLYIGRYRSQGRLSLDGDILDWGKYIQVKPEASSDVAGWIEQLQTEPPRPATRQDEIEQNIRLLGATPEI